MIAAGTVWVAEDADGRLRGFLAAERADDELHIWEIDVLSQDQGRGFGRRLIEEARAYAESAALSALTLTTFRDVPWNAPLYARLGFEMLPTSSSGPRLDSIFEREAGLGLPRERRCAMRYSLARQGRLRDPTASGLGARLASPQAGSELSEHRPTAPVRGPWHARGSLNGLSAPVRCDPCPPWRQWVEGGGWQPRLFGA